MGDMREIGLPGWYPVAKFALCSREQYERHKELADAVTRLGEALDLFRGIDQSAHAHAADVGMAWQHYDEARDAVLAARAALDAGEG